MKKIGGKGSKFVSVPLDDIDRFLRHMGYEPDTKEDVRSLWGQSGREVTYSKETQQVMMEKPNQFVVSVADTKEKKFTGARTVVSAPNIDSVVQVAIETAMMKCTDACEDVTKRAPGHRLVYPAGLEGPVMWVITPLCEQRGRILVRAYTSASANSNAVRGVGQDAIRVAVLYDANGHIRGLDHEARVYRTGTVQGVLQRLGKHLATAEALRVKQCARCGAPAYRDSGRCILRECREAAVQERNTLN